MDGHLAYCGPSNRLKTRLVKFIDWSLLEKMLKTMLKLPANGCCYAFIRTLATST